MRVIHRHLIAYTTRNSAGVAAVTSEGHAPTFIECARTVPGLVTAYHLGAAPTYTLTWHDADGNDERRQLDARRVELLGRFLMRLADRGRVTGIAVHNHVGGDVTFDFPCFRA